MVEQARPRPAPGQHALERLSKKRADIVKTLDVFERSPLPNTAVIDNVRGTLAGLSGFLLKEIEARVISEAETLLGLDYRQPIDLFKSLGVEPITDKAPKAPTKEARKVQRALDKELRSKTPGEILTGISRREKPKKSRGLKDPRQIEFEVPKTKRKLRGKEGKGVRLLFEAPSRILYKEQLANELYPGVNKEKATGMVNKTMRSARKHLVGSGFNIAIMRDYEKKSTFYSLRSWKERRSKKKR